LTYVLLIYRALAEPLPPETEREVLAAHRRVQKRASSRGALHSVARLGDPTPSWTVRRRSGAHETTDGPFIETKEWLVGFYLLDCESSDEAVEQARALCVDEQHVIEVRPVTWMRGP
jgi:hypothetical protein